MEGKRKHSQEFEEYTPLEVPLSAKYIRSFAYKTVQDRLPIILTRLIDRLYREKKELCELFGEDSPEELKCVIGYLSKLKCEMQTNKPLTPITSETNDAKAWNQALIKEKDRLRVNKLIWFDTPWLFIECYFYRRIKEAFESSKAICDYDYFQSLKTAGYFTSLKAMESLGCYLMALFEKISNNEADLEELFAQLIQINLWGNKCDLSFSNGLESAADGNWLDQLKSQKDFVLVDNTKDAWDMLKHSQGESLGIVLDNSGFETFTDFCIADFLLTAGIVSKVTFHCKVHPWFISDTRINDIYWMLKTMNLESTILKDLSQRWQTYFSQDRWSICSDSFWTLPYDYSQMNSVDPVLYQTLASYSNVIFKGDLNYRKLVGDINWKPTEPFHQALRGFLPTNIISLRTLKADVVVGMNEDLVKEVQNVCSDWMVSGDYAVIQCCAKKY